MITKKDPANIQSYLEDASGLRGGNALQVVIPETGQEASDFLLDASRHGTPVTLSGGGTGVTGGRVPFGGTLLSLENFDKVIDIRPAGPKTAVAHVGAGVSIRELKKQAAAAGWMYAPDPTEQGSFLGGNIATNASGSRGLKYGSTRHYIQMLKIVLSGGEILELRRGRHFADASGRAVIPLRNGELVVPLPRYRLPSIKNAAGYYNYPGMDIIDLFIGQEGTLGVVTEAEVTLIPPFRRLLAGIAFFSAEEDSYSFVDEVKRTTAATRSRQDHGGIDALSLEFLDRHALELLRGDYPQIPAGSGAAIYFEQIVDGTDEDLLVDAWAQLLEGHRCDADRIWMGMTEKEQTFFRDFRHRLPENVNEIVRRNGFPKTGTDLAVPADKFSQMLRFYRECLEASGMRHLIFGHIGESHMHANLLPATEKEFLGSKKIYAALAEKALALGGTISAEHGIGKLKHSFLHQMVGDEGIREMAALKKTLDPAGILGRGNIFPESLLS